MSFSCECCVLSGRGLYVGLITRTEGSHRMWCVYMSVTVKPGQRGGHGPLEDLARWGWSSYCDDLFNPNNLQYD
jgi:hypothetical protein